MDNELQLPDQRPGRQWSREEYFMNRRPQTIADKPEIKCKNKIEKQKNSTGEQVNKEGWQ